MNTHEAVEIAARDSYGKLIAWLVSRCGDVALAEDVLGDALEAALKKWPVDGVPDKPEAWLLTVSRRRLIDRSRKNKTRDHATDELALRAAERLQREAMEAQSVPFRPMLPDRRLELMFICAHPEIDAQMRTPLILQTVLGLNAAAIANTMLVNPATMGQRLVRTKRKIKEMALPFELPEGDALEARTKDVLEAIYAAYGTGWEADPNLGDGNGLAGEAIWLSRLLLDLLPESGEAKGLYALLCYCESRRSARRVDGRYVPLEEQDTTLWDHDMILEGEKALWLASKLGDRGPFQIEAAIQSIHAHRAHRGETDWHGIVSLYRVLVDLYPSMGATVGYAASLGRVDENERGLEILDGLDATRVERYQPYWAVRFWLLRALGRPTQEAHDKAIGLCADPEVRSWLMMQAD